MNASRLFIESQREAFADWAYGDGHIWAGWNPADPQMHDASHCPVCATKLLAASGPEEDTG